MLSKKISEQASGPGPTTTYKHLLVVVGAFALFLGFRSVSNPIVFQTLGASTEECVQFAAELSSNLEIIRYEIPETLTSGQSFEGFLRIRKKETVNSNAWNSDWRFFNFSSRIEAPYPKIISQQIKPSLIQFLFSSDDVGYFEFSTPIPKNIAGIGKHTLNITLVDENYYYCRIAAAIGGSTFFISNQPDITPPLVRKVQYDKVKYSPGDQVKVTLTLSEPLRDLFTDHFEFVSTNIANTKHYFPKFSSSRSLEVKEIGQNRFQVSFTVPMETPAGIYRLNYFNRYDSQDNFEDSVGVNDSDEKSVVESSLLEVVM